MGTDKGCGYSWDGGNRDEGCGSCGDGVTVRFEGFRVLSNGVDFLLMG